MALQQDSIDSLHLPLRGGGTSQLDVQLPQYYREGFFSKDTLLHPELPGGRQGVAGAPIPYNIHNDSIITSMLLAFFILLVLSVATIREFIVAQIKKFFYVPSEATSELVVTGNEIRIQLFMVLLNSLLLALLYYFYTLYNISDSFNLTSQYYLIVIYTAVIVAYFLAKALLYTIVNLVFFGSKRNRHWMKAIMFITSMEGLMLLPAVFLQTYFGMTEQNVIIYFIIVLIFVKILTFFKTYTVFFRTNVAKLQIFLYFCALEMMPLLALWTALDYVANSLKIIF